MVLIDASTRWFYVSLLSTHNLAFAKMLIQIIRLRSQFPDFPIKSIGLDNAGEFTSRSFNDYCLTIGIDVEHYVAHTHTYNGLVESFLKRLKFIARPLILNSNLSFTIWRHAIMHATTLIQIRPSTYHSYSHYNLYVSMSLIFLIWEFLVVLYMYLCTMSMCKNRSVKETRDLCCL